ncbi:unnamed protein product [Macrosiphum euphorbiae]|uniref:Uncharacterized protein n=1 Tax=Macrosiphum euphorbiae TaxID=13131 RepID=A0AAV0X7P5_9HEMI|nr:unnamed protein product [Macrosiphum euphorbiae]
MDCAGSSRYLLAVAMIAMALSLGCAAPMFGLTLSSQRNTGDSDPTSPLSKLPLPIPLPNISERLHSRLHKHRMPQSSATNAPTSPENKQQDSQQQPQQISPEPTVAEQPGGKDPYQSLANASVTTSPRPKMETTTHNILHFIGVPLKKCSEGQVFNKHRKCVAKRERSSNPEDEEDSSTILVSTIRRL